MKKFFVLLIVMMFAIPAIPAVAQNVVNVAPGKSVSVSSQTSDANYAADGDEETVWQSDEGSDQFITLDLGMALPIHSVQILGEGGEIVVYAADNPDMKNPCMLECVEGIFVLPKKDHENPYFRYLMVTKDLGSLCVAEFQVWVEEYCTRLTNITPGKAYTIGGQDDAGSPCARMVDDNEDTLGVVVSNPPQSPYNHYIQIDLGLSRRLDHIELVMRRDLNDLQYLTGYHVWISDDVNFNSYTSLLDQQEGESFLFKSTAAVPANENRARYVRVFNDNAFFMALNEIKVITEVKPPVEYPGYKELASGKSVFVNSGTENAGALNDGDDESGWSSQGVEDVGAEACIDLGRSYPVDFIEISAILAGGGFDIILSNDPHLAETAFVDYIDQDNTQHRTELNGKQYARFIGIRQKTAGKTIEIGEIRVFIHEEYMEYENIAQGQTSILGRDVLFGTTPDNLTDEREDTFIAAEAFDGFIGIDLGNLYEIEHVEVVLRQDNLADENDSERSDMIMVAAQKPDFSDGVVIAEASEIPRPRAETWVGVPPQDKKFRYIKFCRSSDTNGVFLICAEMRIYANPDEIVYPWTVTGNEGSITNGSLQGMGSLEISVAVTNKRNESQKYLMITAAYQNDSLLWAKPMPATIEPGEKGTLRTTDIVVQNIPGFEIRAFLITGFNETQIKCDMLRLTQ